MREPRQGSDNSGTISDILKRIATSYPFRLLLALLLPVMTLSLQWTVWDLQPYPWVFFYFAVFISSWIGGFVAGVLATLLSTALVWGIFIPFEGTFGQQDIIRIISAALFIASGILFSILHARLRTASRLGSEAYTAVSNSEQRLHDLFEQASEGIFIAEPEGRITSVNTAGALMLGYPRQKLIGKYIADLLLPDETPRLEEVHHKLLAGETNVSEWHLRHAEGHYIPAEICTNILPEGRWQSFVRDISERKQAEEKLHQAAIVFDSALEGILITDAKARILTVNQAFSTITGFKEEEARGKNLSSQISRERDKMLYQQIWQDLRHNGNWQGEVWLRRKNGQVFPTWSGISEVKDAEGRTTHYVSVISDISMIRQAEERLSYLASYDVLTGLPNRRLFNTTLESSLARAQRQEKMRALLFLDVDRFKLVNDTLGHSAGDRLLQEIGERLNQCVRTEDMVARLSGDEFTIIIEEISHPDDAAHIAEKIARTMTKPVLIADREMVVSISIGISMYPDDALTAGDLTKAADAALYRAKDLGRHTYAFYTDEITAQAVERLSLENGLRQAMSANELELFYQPQFNVASGKMVGLEALLRWRHPSQGIILPARFIEVAEETVLIEVLGEWVIRRVCLQIRQWLDKGLEPGRIAINISTRQISHSHVARSVREAMQDNNLGPDDVEIELEVTESALQSTEANLDRLREIQAQGVQLAIDDFGTGYSSLSRLQQLPVDTLKIDQIFVSPIPDDADSKAIISAVISLGHSLGMRVIAEGVEHASQLDFLREEGCDEIQGFLVGRAVSADVISKILPKRGALSAQSSSRAWH